MDIGLTSIERTSIQLKSNVAVHRPSYRSKSENIEIEKQVESFLQWGLIRHSLSSYASPIPMAEKKCEGRTRMCNDYRKLNFFTVLDYQPIPRVDDIFYLRGSSRFFSVLDTTFGYSHVPMKKKGTGKPECLTRSGYLEWIVMSLGLRNAPATFQLVGWNICLTIPMT